MPAGGIEPLTPSMGSRHAHHYPTVAVVGSSGSLKGLYLLLYKNIYLALFTSPWGMNSALKIIHEDRIIYISVHRVYTGRWVLSNVDEENITAVPVKKKLSTYWELHPLWFIADSWKFRLVLSVKFCPIWTRTVRYFVRNQCHLNSPVR